MTALVLRDRASCRYDLVSLGEVMLRLDPGEGRIATTRTFNAWEGGGEYNVARGLKRCFGLNTAVVTALADNPVGHLIDDLIYQGGVERAQLEWMPYDGVGRSVRNGLNFTERGFGVRGAVGCSDRGHSAASQLKPGVIDWERIFGAEGARWFHCGGIFAALSETTAEVALEAMGAARRHGTVVSYDLNFRPSLWQAIGGATKAASVNRQLVEHVDVLLGNEEDFSAALGFHMEGVDPEAPALDLDAYGALLSRVMESFEQLGIVATTLRSVKSATINDWNAMCSTRSGVHLGPQMQALEVFDRVGGGDSFASGFFFGLMEGLTPDAALAWGVAHGALAMTTPGDTSMATFAEVERLVGGASARVRR